MNHFKEIYYDSSFPRLESQLKTIKNFPRFFNDEDCRDIGKKIELEEVLKTLNLFGKDKSLGLNS